MRSVVEAGAAVPAFLAKLWKLVNDCDTNHLISWSSEGKAFCIQNQAEFARELLPLYYKHNNMASFIRQLNMYGFHKVASVETGGLRCDKDEIEFSHPCFMDGHAYLLEHIKRKLANPKPIVTNTGDKILLNPELMNKVLSDVKQMKGRQESMDARFSVMKQENEALWREIAILRQKHIKQQQIVNNLIQFLMSLVQPSRGGGGMNSGVKRRYQLMIENAAHNSADIPKTKNPRLDPVTDYNVEHDEEFPEEQHDQMGDADSMTIHELAQDDLLSCESAQMPSDYITVEVPPRSPALSASSPLSREGGHQTAYQIGDAGITQTDRDELFTHDALSLCDSPIISSPSATTPTPAPSSSPAPAPSPSPQHISSSSLHLMVSPLPITKTYKKLTNSIKTEKSSSDPILGFNSMQHLDTMPLPADIFADDSISEESAPRHISLSDVDHQAAISQENASVVDFILENQSMGLPEANLFKTHKGINSKSVAGQSCKAGEKKPKSKKEEVMYGEMIKPADIKQEWLEDSLSNDMSVAMRDSSMDFGRFGNVTRTNNYNNNRDITTSSTKGYYGTTADSEVDDHLESMQNDLESLRELLRGDNYSLDANTLLGPGAAPQPDPPLRLQMLLPEFTLSTSAFDAAGLFNQDDPFHGLSLNLLDDRPKDKNSDAEDSNQLITYTASPLLQLDDLNLSLAEPDPSSPPGLTPASDLPPLSPRLDDAPLQTPQVSLTPRRDPFHNYARN